LRSSNIKLREEKKSVKNYLLRLLKNFLAEVREFLLSRHRLDNIYELIQKNNMEFSMENYEGQLNKSIILKKPLLKV
jgi:hypothetical protein